MTPASRVSVVLDGEEVDVPAAVSIAAALAARGQRELRRSRPSGQPRAVFCGMGACHECVVTVDGVPGVRACITPVGSGMRINTGLTTGRTVEGGTS